VSAPKPDPVKAAPPATAVPPAAPPPVGPPKGEAFGPKVEPVKAAVSPPPKFDAPKIDPPKPEPVKVEFVRPDPVKAEPPKMAAAPPVPQPASGGGTGAMVLGGLALLCAVAAGAGGYFVWDQLHRVVQPAVATLQSDLKTLSDRNAQLTQRLAQLEQRPAPAAAAASPAPAADLRPLEARIAALEQRPAVVADTSAALAGAVQKLEQKAADTDAQAAKLAARAALLARLQAASAALEAGKPLGDLPGAPPALTRFAAAAPPSMAALRLSFPAAETSAVNASRPDTGDKSAGEKVWIRISSLVTVRQGTNVLVGSPAVNVLETARGKLEAGDLAGAIAGLDDLDRGAAAAMAPWRANAQALLDAREALSAMARS
jgi:hypothetical protein